MIRSAGITSLHLALLLLLAYFCFTHHAGILFLGNDGPMVMSLINEQLMFHGVSPDLHTSFHQGIGNLSFPLNVSFMPGYWLPFTDDAGNFTPWWCYMWFVGLCFITVLMTAATFGFSFHLGLAAAWLITVLLFPFVEAYFRIYAVTASSPNFIWHLFCASLGSLAISRLAGSWRQWCGACLLWLLTLYLIMAATPPAIILMLPLWALHFLFVLIWEHRDGRIRLVAGGTLVLLVCAALGWVEYALGLTLYSSSGFFMHELADTYSGDAQFSSILFQGFIKDRAFGTWLFILAFAGAFWAVYTNHPRYKKPAILTLAGQAFHAGLAAGVLKLLGGWSGPPPIYTEMTFFALYGLFALFYIAELGKRFLTKAHLWAAPAFAAAIALVVAAHPAQPERNLINAFAMPPQESPITRILAREIPALPDHPFAGRVATILPGNTHAQMRYAYQLNVTAKNDHQTTGLWLYNIPTLHEYNQLITPAYYKLMRTFLTQPNDVQYRSSTNYSAINHHVLSMLGVRYLLTFGEQHEGFSKVGTLRYEYVPPLTLLENPDTNIHGIAASSVISATYGKDILNAMQQDGFDGTQAVMNTEKLPASLSPLEISHITVEHGNYRIRATSTGTSLLVVPIEYSHCLTLQTIDGEKPTLYRVNLALTGILFEKEMDILLGAHIGPFTQPRCRFKDYLEFKKLWGET